MSTTTPTTPSPAPSTTVDVPYLECQTIHYQSCEDQYYASINDLLSDPATGILFCQWAMSITHEVPTTPTRNCAQFRVGVLGT